MLYHLHELQRRFLNPLSVWAQATSELFTSPYSPLAYTPVSRRLAAGYDLLHRVGKYYEKPEFGLRTTTVDGKEVPVVEESLETKPFCRLLHFRRVWPNGMRKRPADPKILIVAPLSGHHATLLRDTVRALLPDHDVSITDWTDARLVPLAQGPFHLDDYVEYVMDFIRLLGPDVHVISVCQPTVPVLAAVSLMASNGETTPLTMTMMGGPIDARKSPTAVNNLAMDKSHSWFENSVIYRVPQNFPGAGRRVYPGFMQYSGFVAMNPDRHVTSHYDYFLDLVRGDEESAESHREFYDEYNAVLDMPAEYYLDTIKKVFQEFALVNGTWVVNGQPVRPQDIRNTALLTIEGELDDISGAGQTKAAHLLCTGIPPTQQFHYDAEGAGHYGIFSGRRWREMVYPRVREFIASHDQPPAAKPAAKPAAAPARAKAARLAPAHAGARATKGAPARRAAGRA